MATIVVDGRLRSRRPAGAAARAAAVLCASAVRAHAREPVEVTATFKQKKFDLVRARLRSGQDCGRKSTSTIRGAGQFVRLDGALFGRSSAERCGYELMQRTTAWPRPQTVLAFWRAAGPERWFEKDDGLRRRDPRKIPRDLRVRGRGRAQTGKRRPKARSRLLIVLDQFPRNMFRGRCPRFYGRPACARRGRSARSSAASTGGSRCRERRFFYLPFEHSETLADQERCVALIPRARATPTVLKWAELHADIIRRFGRFPHRNTVLGRATTAEEQTFLDGGGFAG